MPTRRRMLTMSLAGLSSTAGAVGAGAQAPPPQAPGTLGPIRGVTITAADLNAVEAAWTTFMGYRLVQKGAVPAATAQSWGAPAVTGQPFIVLGPESGEATFLRFVQQASPKQPTAGPTFGWSTTEITVQDSDKLYDRLKTSSFKVTNPPSLVPTYSYLKAMQAEGPAGERLNLTWITEPRPDLAVAKSFVGRCFIVVQGGPDLPATLKFFADNFGTASSPIRQLPTLKLAVVPLGDGAKIEADQLGPNAGPRPRPPGGLPPGVAIVTFECSSFERHQSLFLKPPGPGAMKPTLGKPTATIVGPSGELLELMAV